MKYIASVSFGKDSLAMLLQLIEKRFPLDAVVFYNTGMEFDAIYRIRDKMKIILLELGIEFVELCPKEEFLCSMLERKVKYRYKDGFHYGYGWCGGRCRWGTSEKIESIKKYKKSLGDTAVDYVGIAADEILRFEKSRSEDKRFPLVQFGMSESDCLSYCRKRGFEWIEQTDRTENGFIDLYEILDRVSCWCCTNKNLKELRNIYKFLPRYWSKLRDLQKLIPSPMKGSGKSIFDLERRFVLENEWIAEKKRINTKEFFDAIKGK